MVTGVALIRTAGVSAAAVHAALNNERLVRAMARRTTQNLARMSERDVVAAVVGKVTSQSPEPIRAALYRRFDEVILGHIAGFSGTPTLKSLARAIRAATGHNVSSTSVGARARADPAIGRALVARGKAWAESVSDRELLGFLSKAASLQGVDPVVHRTIARRFERLARKRLARCEDVPTAHWLAKEIRKVGPLHELAVRAWLERLPALAQEIRDRGLAFVRRASAAELVAFLGSRKSGTVAEEIRAVLDARLVQLVRKQIERSPVLPTIESLTKTVGFRSQSSVQRLVDGHTSLRRAMVERTRTIVNEADDTEFLACRARWTIQLQHAEPRVQALISDRFVQVLARTVECLDVPPTPAALGRALNTDPKLIAEYFARTPKLSRLQQQRFAAWAKPHVQERPLISRKGARNRSERSATLPGEILAQVDASGGDVDRLARGLRVSRDMVLRRLASDPVLFERYWATRGFTLDQALELNLQRGVPEALRELLVVRLRHLHAYREMVALLRTFGPELRGEVVELSLYPEPLRAAAADLGLTLDGRLCWVGLEDFRRGKQVTVPRADTVVLQGVHRLHEQPLRAALAIVRGAVASQGRVLVTYGSDYFQPRGFEAALEGLGLRVREAGQLRFEVPSRQTLQDAGVSRSEASRVAAKMAGSAQVLVLEPVRATSSRNLVPRLRRRNLRRAPPTAERGDGRGMDVPSRARTQIATRFVSATREDVSAEPFLLTIAHGAETLAVLAYGANPGEPRAELVTYPGASPEEPWRNHLGALVRSTALRRALRLHRGERRISLARLRGATEAAGRSE